MIEQAKGVLAHLHTIDMDTAFTNLRQYARSHNLTLREVADGVVNKSLTL